ncbi:MAG: hypothetical protein J5534_14575 [Fibrobacter sp.]|nr:hypothetical protein [Fibrobacter sp.]
MFNAILAWVKNEKVFLKVQSGTGDNLQDEDVQKGFVDYCLWSTFKPECIDIDGELDMECLDGGMVLFKECVDAEIALQACYKEAFDKEYDGKEVVVIFGGMKLAK